MKFKLNYENHPCDTEITGVSKTQQQFKDEADIYRILARHTKGLPVPTNGKEPIYTDVSEFDPRTNKQNLDALKLKADKQRKDLAKELETIEISKHEKLAEKLNKRKEENDKNNKISKNAETTNSQNNN